MLFPHETVNFFVKKYQKKIHDYHGISVNKINYLLFIIYYRIDLL